MWVFGIKVTALGLCQDGAKTLSLPLPTDTVLIIAVKAFGEEREEGGKGKELSDLSKFMQQALVTLYLPPHHCLQAEQEGDALSLGGEELSVP